MVKTVDDYHTVRECTVPCWLYSKVGAGPNSALRLSYCFATTCDTFSNLPPLLYTAIEWNFALAAMMLLLVAIASMGRCGIAQRILVRVAMRHRRDISHTRGPTTTCRAP